MPVILTSILSLIQYAPQAITEISALYEAVRADLSTEDQAQIDAALAAAQASDANATAVADTALTTASEN